MSYSYPATPSHSPPRTPLRQPRQQLPPSPESPLHKPIPRPPTYRSAPQQAATSGTPTSDPSHANRGGIPHPLSPISDTSTLVSQHDNYDEKQQLSGPLFLSIDAGVKKVRASVLDQRLQVVWVEQVEVDTELPEYGTRNGVYTIGGEITCPSELRIKAVDLLLEKLAQDAPEGLLGRVVAISGATQSSAPHFLSHDFPALLSTLHLPNSSSHQRLSTLLTSSTAFSLPCPPTRTDSSTAAQVNEMELAVGSALVATSLPSSSSLQPEGSATTEGSAEAAGGRSLPPGHDESLALRAGRASIVQRTGGKVGVGSMAAQVMKVRQRDEAMAVVLSGQQVDTGEEEDVEGERRVSEEGSREDEQGGVLERTSRICLESTLLGSLFLGRLAPTDATDAASTSLYDPNASTSSASSSSDLKIAPIQGDWDEELLGIVMGDHELTREFYPGDQLGAERLRGMLGEVVRDGGKALGTISPYFVHRFGFSSDTLIIPFTSDHAASFLSYPLASKDAMLCLGVGDGDALLALSRAWLPSAEEGRSIVPHPARREGGSAMSAEDGEGEEDGEQRWIAMMFNKDAALGRSLVRDLYCNGQWSVFSRLTAIVPHGGTIGLDDKYFSFFFPHGETNGAVQGLSRFMSGTYTTHYPDPKVNPRLLLESQFLSLRFRLSRLYLALSTSITSSSSTSPTPPPLSLLKSPHPAPLNFPPLSPLYLPTRLLLTGAPAQNGAIVSLASTVCGAPAVFVDETTEMADSGGGHEFKTTSSALGAGYKAAWGWSRVYGWGVGVSEEGEGEGEEREQREFGTFVAEVKRAAREEAQVRSKEEQEEVERGRSLLNVNREPISFGAGDAGAAEVDGVRRAASMSGAENGAHEEPHEGITLVAEPDAQEFKFYSSMLREHVRLEAAARRGLI